MQDWINDVTTKMWGKSQAECIEGQVCVICHEPAKRFKDNISYKEYEISGMCQGCQDKTF